MKTCYKIALAVVWSSSVLASNHARLKYNPPPQAQDDNGFFLLRMGSSFDSSSFSATSGQSCVAASYDPANIYIANPQASITLQQRQDSYMVERALGVDITSMYGGDRFTLSAASQFASNSKDNAYTSNLIYLFKYNGVAVFTNGSLHQGDRALTPEAQEWVHKDQYLFRQMCGDSFVEQIDAGLVLGVNLSLSFNSHSDQEKFNASFNAKAGLANVATAIRQAAEQSKVHVTFSLSAIQLGGEPQRLNDVFGEKDPIKGYPFIECGSIDSPKSAACDNMTSAIITYAKTIVDQVTAPNGKMRLDNLYYTDPTTSNYMTLGIYVGAPDPSPAIKQAMRDLTKSYDQTLANYIFASNYVRALEDQLDTQTKATLNDAALRLKTQLTDVYLNPVYRVMNCYKGYVSEDCLQIKQDVEKAIRDHPIPTVETEMLDFMQNSSYKTDLYIYTASSTKDKENLQDKTNYTRVKGCIFAPISSPTNARYAITCNGVWLPTMGDFTVRYNAVKKMLNVSGLDYMSPKIAEHNDVRIHYFDSDLLPDSFDIHDYYGNKISLYANESAAFETDLNVFLAPRNDA